ncbi:nucleotidyltransferase family protein [Caldimonas manganoxidans]|uniref:nucleotidyltransferase family protein n=1 Tax=Caldimonas manganoxidans TaxID=196015 RepID=UPI000369BF12|nr:nucleotidyltransferase family protein [Caldimonas manganoxidans]
MSSSPVVIVLAAGAGSRFEGAGHKLTQALGSTTVLGATLQQVLASRLRLVVVTTSGLRDMVKGWVATQDVVVVPAGSDGAGEHLGMGYSIAAGVRARGDASGWLVMPGDMPLVRPSTLRAVAMALSAHPVAYAQFQGRRGHPVGFAAELYSELAVLDGDQGARRILARYPAAAVEVDDPGVLVDIDTRADLLSVQARLPPSGAVLAAHRERQPP